MLHPLTSNRIRPHDHTHTGCTHTLAADQFTIRSAQLHQLQDLSSGESETTAESIERLFPVQEALQDFVRDRFQNTPCVPIFLGCVMDLCETFLDLNCTHGMPLSLSLMMMLMMMILVMMMMMMLLLLFWICHRLLRKWRWSGRSFLGEGSGIPLEDVSESSLDLVPLSPGVVCRRK